jgi:predicted MFS family arabinose efflux permease
VSWPRCGPRSPCHARHGEPFAAALPCLIATWALGGLYLSLGPSLAAQATGSPNLLWGGLVIFLICGTGAAAAFVLRNINSRAAMLAGCLLLLAGMAVTFGAIATTTSAAFLAGTAIAGTGFGLAFLGSFRMTTAQAAPDQRAGLLAAIFIVSYLAFSVPALIAGVATTRFGLHSTALVYSASLAALAAASILLFHSSGKPSWPTPASHVVMPPGPCTAGGHPALRLEDVALAHAYAPIGMRIRCRQSRRSWRARRLTQS